MTRTPPCVNQWCMPHPDGLHFVRVSVQGVAATVLTSRKDECGDADGMPSATIRLADMPEQKVAQEVRLQLRTRTGSVWDEVARQREGRPEGGLDSNPFPV